MSILEKNFDLSQFDEYREDNRREVGMITDKRGQEIEVNLYNERAQNYILDNLYEMI